MWVFYFKCSVLRASPASLPQCFSQLSFQASLNTANHPHPCKSDTQSACHERSKNIVHSSRGGSLFLQFLNDDNSTCQSSFITWSWSTEACKVWLCISGNGVWEIARGHHRLPGKLPCRRPVVNIDISRSYTSNLPTGWNSPKDKEHLTWTELKYFLHIWDLSNPVRPAMIPLGWSDNFDKWNLYSV